jgi:tripartite-type tricarboxylate transporter receptor subunit TctC
VKLSRRELGQLASIAVAIMLMSLSGNHSWAQAMKTTKIIVPYPPGGTNDTIARVLGEQVGRAQGRTIVIENRPGASTKIGTEAASRAAPDGNSCCSLAPTSSSFRTCGR